jgi:hypothetical protein
MYFTTGLLKSDYFCGLVSCRPLLASSLFSLDTDVACRRDRDERIILVYKNCLLLLF